MDEAGIVRDILARAGIAVNGNNPWDIDVHDTRFYNRLLGEGILGAGESYMDRWWDCKALDQFVYRAARADLDRALSGDKLRLLIYYLRSRALNLQSKARAFRIGEHYNLGNDLFEKMLGRSMVYSCGYWRSAQTLDGAQENKLNLVCRKIGLQQGMKILDIGCGWGSFAKFACERFGARVTGITVSEEQLRFAGRVCKDLPIELRLQDYREVNGEFDAVVSIGMFEHVGHKNYRTFMEIVSKCLKDEGVALLHTIGNNLSVKSCSRWTDKYIFPNGMLPSISQIGKSIEGLFVIEDLHNFGEDYYKTAMEWNRNFQDAWPELSNKYPDRFKRMWEFYLLSGCGLFLSRTQQVWQLVLTKVGRKQPMCRFS